MRNDPSGSRQRGFSLISQMVGLSLFTLAAIIFMGVHLLAVRSVALARATERADRLAADKLASIQEQPQHLKVVETIPARKNIGNRTGTFTRATSVTRDCRGESTIEVRVSWTDARHQEHSVVRRTVVGAPAADRLCQRAPHWLDHAIALR